MIGLHAYHVSQMIAKDDPPFFALISAAMQKADTDNLARLRFAFPEEWAELRKRYDASLGVLPEDGDVDVPVLVDQLNRMRKSWERVSYDLIERIETVTMKKAAKIVEEFCGKDKLDAHRPAYEVAGELADRIRSAA